VDDCSDDDTYERVVERFGRDKRLCAIRLSENVGPYQIKNWVIGSLARGDLVALQDADDISHPLRLEEQGRWMATHGYRISGTGAHQFFPPGIQLPLGVGQPLAVDGMLHNIAFYPTVERTQEPTSLRKLLQKRNGADFLDGYCTGPYDVYKYTVADHGSQMMERSLFLEFGGFDSPTRMAADTDFNFRLLRFHSLGNVPKVLYSRRFHELSLTQHPATNLTSPARQEYRVRRDLRQEQIRRELEAGDLTKARELCTAGLFYQDIKVQQVNSGFTVTDSRLDLKSGNLS
jgi:glycosyltransferase involved in cell wall biosynthesis